MVLSMAQSQRENGSYNNYHPALERLQVIKRCHYKLQVHFQRVVYHLPEKISFILLLILFFCISTALKIMSRSQ